MNLATDKTIALVFALILLSSFQSNFSNAQQFTDSNFAAKGKTAHSSHFPGIIIWTQVKGVDGTFVFHGLNDELVVLRTTLAPSDECEQGLLCYDGTVNSAKNSPAIQVGDTFKLIVDTATNTEHISFLSGFLENVDVKIDLKKIKTNPVTTSTLTPSSTSSNQTSNVYDIISDAYIFGYPLVTMDVTKKVVTNVPNATAQAAPVNQFANLLEFPNPDFKTVVRPNADTLYSTAWLDLSKEPIILHVPDTQGRYYMMPMLDAWTNVFSVPGKRTTGTGAGDFMIEGPSWNGNVPAGVTEIKSPTDLVWIIGRTQTNGPEDYDAVHEIQKQYTLIPLSSFGKSYQSPQNVPVDPTVDMKTPPVNQINNMDASTFFNKMSALMKDNPPAAVDADEIKKFESIGLKPGHTFDTSKFDPVKLDQAIKVGLQKIVDRAKSMGTIKNGWRMILDIGSYDTRYLDRAAIALFGLGANLPQDAIYPVTGVDSQGNQLNGANKYVIHFQSGQTPPVSGFWSITMYEGDGFFVKNPIDRYAIGDRSNLVNNQDGSLDIYIQHDSPQGHESNWLPSPQGDFDLTLRLYWSQESIINGTWNLPLVQLVK